MYLFGSTYTGFIISTRLFNSRSQLSSVMYFFSMSIVLEFASPRLLHLHRWTGSYTYEYTWFFSGSGRYDRTYSS